MRLWAPVALLVFFAFPALAWDNHSGLTQASLSDSARLPKVSYEPIEKVLNALSVPGSERIKSVSDLANALRINAENVKWRWSPGERAASAREVLIYSVEEPDFGMDQNLNLSVDQKFMGGYSGLSSQGVRHMYYRKWSVEAPLTTFHIPMREMGFAIERAQLYFDLAVQSKRAGHLFWAYRFLGWGLHYVQDLAQPYHTTQFASFSLLPVRMLAFKGWEAFIRETTRLVSNFHLSFEKYVEFRLQDSKSGFRQALMKNGSEDLKLDVEREGSIPDGLKTLAEVSSGRAAKLVRYQEPLVGKQLREPALDLGAGFYDKAGKAKVDFSAIADSDDKRELESQAEKALADTGAAVRWYVSQFETR